jgi:hypothetical protein
LIQPHIQKFPEAGEDFKSDVFFYKLKSLPACGIGAEKSYQRRKTIFKGYLGNQLNQVVIRGYLMPEEGLELTLTVR